MACPSENRLAALVAEGAGLGRHPELIEHAADCAACRRLLLAVPGSQAAVAGDAPVDDDVPGASAPATPRPGDVLDERYRIERRLGGGGMGVVFVATHLGLGTPVAIKFIVERRAAEPAERRRFVREARIAARLTSDHVVKVFDVAEDERFGPYVVMELLDGHDLAHELGARGRLPVGEAVALVLDACAALAEAHARDIVHRDIKPANLFLAQRPGGAVVKVLDFGLAKATPEPHSDEVSLTSSRAVLGSPLYMAPEQAAAAKDVDARADVWSLGVVLHECLTGASPFRGVHLVEVIAKITSPAPVASLRKLAPEVPAGLDAVVLRCLRKPRDERFASVAELARALAPFATAPRPAALALIAAPARSSRPRVLAGAAAAALLVVGALVARAVFVDATPRTAAAQVDDAGADVVQARAAPAIDAGARTVIAVDAGTDQAATAPPSRPAAAPPRGTRVEGTRRDGPPDAAVAAPPPPAVAPVDAGPPSPALELRVDAAPPPAIDPLGDRK